MMLDQFDRWGFRIHCGSGLSADYGQATIAEGAEAARPGAHDGDGYVERCRSATWWRHAWACPLVFAGLALSIGLLLGFQQPDSLNRWPLRGPQGDRLAITPTLRASSGETLRQLALADVGIVCLADFMTAADRARGDLVPLLVKDTVVQLQPVHAVYYRNTRLAARIACFLDFVAERMAT